MKRFLRNNGLSLVLAAFFLIFWACQAVSGWKVHTEEAILHQQPPVAFTGYLATGHFWQATGENWESEFLQMAAYVVLTCFLFQKGSDWSRMSTILTGPSAFAKMASMTLRPVPARLSVISMSCTASILPAGFTSR